MKLVTVISLVIVFVFSIGCSTQPTSPDATPTMAAPPTVAIQPTQTIEEPTDLPTVTVPPTAPQAQTPEWLQDPICAGIDGQTDLFLATKFGIREIYYLTDNGLRILACKFAGEWQYLILPPATYTSVTLMDSGLKPAELSVESVEKGHQIIGGWLPLSLLPTDHDKKYDQLLELIKSVERGEYKLEDFQTVFWYINK